MTEGARQRKHDVAIVGASILAPAIAITLILLIPDSTVQANGIAALGNTFLAVMIISTAGDCLVLAFKHRSILALPFVTLCMAGATFALMEICFLSDKFHVVYAWSYSSFATPLAYKAVAIWAGEAGSIITWMTFNAAFVLAFRFRPGGKNNATFLFASITGTIVMLVFQLILVAKDPFRVEPPFPPSGFGLNLLLQSPFMVWHPLFVFLAYSAYLIPFTLVVSSLLLKKSLFETSQQRKFVDFSLRFGWLVLTLGIGIGSYWAKLALSWGRFWGWDPVETVSLVPWFFATSIFHARGLDKGKLRYYKLNLLLVFVGITFSTFVTRGGGLTSLHAFTGGEELIILVLIAGFFLLVATFLAIFKAIDDISEGYKDSRLLVNMTSYLCFLILVFICIIGLTIPPLTLVLSATGLFVPIILNPNFYVTGMLVPALCLSASLSFCTLLKQVRTLAILVSMGLLAGAFIVTAAILPTVGLPSFNPLIGIYVFTMITPLVSIAMSKKVKVSFRTWFKRNARNLVHAGLACILSGTLSDGTFFQEIMYITGFFVLVGSMVPTIFVSLVTKNVIDEKDEVKDSGRNPDSSD
jgi:cytochrome c-type biogenesis protein CcmF